jgi:hypothetical protein
VDLRSSLLHLVTSLYIDRKQQILAGGQHIGLGRGRGEDVRIPAFSELPMINVVHPAYHAFPKGGQGNFPASGNLRFNCVLVLATVVLHQRCARNLPQSLLLASTLLQASFR